MNDESFSGIVTSVERPQLQFKATDKSRSGISKQHNVAVW